jgi:multidrug efflux pump subunit AcrA (membrane-fusion protein)
VAVSSGGGGALYEGMYVNVTIPGADVPTAVTVPRRALYNDRFVYVVHGQRLKQLPVQVARIEHDSVIVSGGLTAGDTLVTEMLQGVAAGIPAVSRRNGSGSE